MTASTAASLINLLGFITGAILYGMLLWMVLTSRPTLNRLALLTGLLGLAWNLGAFVGLVGAIPMILAAAFGALCFLPAVVVHSAVRTGDLKSRWKRPVVVGAYLMSGGASLLHFHSAFTFGVAPSQIALRGLTVGFGLLLIGLLFKTRGQEGRGRALWVAALSVFAVSALHLSYHEGGEDRWWFELISHNASVPLAVAILYQDYRFAFADIFLKRALGFVLLVSLIFGGYMFGVAPMLRGPQPLTERSILVMLAMWAATALLYPWIRRNAERFVDRVVLRRTDYSRLLSNISRALDHCESRDAVMNEISSSLAVALTASSVTWRPSLTTESEFSVQSNRNSAIVPILTVHEPHAVLVIGQLSAGRRLLSDDTALIEKAALLAARRIDAVQTMADKYERDLREQEMRQLTAEAELRALRAQINPHFLFNALTTIGYLIQTTPSRALDTLIRLSGLLRSVLRSGEESVTVGEELDLIESYLDIERARFEDRLRLRIDVPSELRSIRIPVLLLQPLVENAVKHGISPCVEGGEIRIAGRKSGDVLIFTIADTGIGGTESEFQRGRIRGVGLGNVERRLQCYAGDPSGLLVKSIPGEGTVVEVRLPEKIMFPKATAS